MRGRSWVWEVAEEDIHGRARAKEPRDPSSKQVVTICKRRPAIRARSLQNRFKRSSIISRLLLTLSGSFPVLQ
jgi:hypothetical protein